jgi:VIT1/CCC1 family predicted Fe2+/Mn2+ transporter
MDVLNKTSKRVLEPQERIAEVLFGLIMVLTFTGSLSVAQADRENIRTMLIAALGCNMAWGIIDGVLYLLGGLAEKRGNRIMLRDVLKSDDPQKAHRLISGALPPLIASLLQSPELETIHQRLRQLPQPAGRAGLGRRDWLGALGVFLLVLLSTFPVVLPFIFMQNAAHALRTSNAIAILMLFIAGVAYGRCIDCSPWRVGVAMVGVGVVLVALTIALGG